MSRVVVVAPHPDDEVIGCGGTLINHKNNGDRIFILYLTTGEMFICDKENYLDKVNIRKCEAKSVCNEMGFDFLYWSDIPARTINENYCKIQKDLIKIFQYVKPNYVYIPHNKEKDFDHVISHNIAKEAYWLSQAINKSGITNSVNALVYNYEIWSPLNEIHKYVSIDHYMEKKIELIEIYKSQMGEINYSEGIRGLNKYRSAFAGGLGFAEAFILESF
jgi:N-acetylglucosamine malate deacetylase 1